MKKLIILLFIFILIGCSEANKVITEPKAENVILTSDKNIIIADGNDKVKFDVKVKDSEGNDLDISYDIFMNNIKYNKNEFSTTTAGEYTFYAEAEKIKSNSIKITAQKNNIKNIKIDNYDKKAIIVLNKKGESEYSIENIGNIGNDLKNSNNNKKDANKKIIKKDRQRIVMDKETKLNLKKINIKKITENTLEHNFLVYDYSTSKYSTVEAEKVYGISDSNCIIYVQKNSKALSTTNWQIIGEYFDNSIYERMVEVFGYPTDIDSNNKIVIFYMDMGGDYFGYFDPIDYGAGNNMEVLYMNSELGDYGYPPSSEEMMSTLSHEFQHLINYGRRYETGKPEIDIWIDEALAMAAEHYISNQPRNLYLDIFRDDEMELIRNGKPLCYFDYNDNGESYALSYTFIQYCKNQHSEKEKIYKMLIEHEYGDYRAIEDIMKKNNGFFIDFETLITSYRIANLINAEGVYGYGTERNIFNFTENNVVKTPTEKFIGFLAPGGAVYYYPNNEYFNSFSSQEEGNNIRFIKISSD